jgi:TonB-dependent starch-binding outer membrane protein SusC
MNSTIKPYKDMQKNSTVYWIAKLMRITFLQLAIAMILCGVGLARDNYGQGLLDKTITCRYQGQPLQKILDGIEEVAGVRFAYSGSHLYLDDSISLEATNRKLGDVLGQLLTPRNIWFAEENDFIVLSLRQQQEVAPGQVGIGTREEANVLVAITGTVTDAATLQPLPGVNIIVKGTTNGTTTDADGKFVIAANDNDVLVFSFIGFKSIETPVGGRTVIDVPMEADITALQEVEINAGYWTVKKQEQTGNIVKVKAEDIEKQPISNPIAALQGRVAGLEVTQGTGVPGGSFTVRVRGTNSIINGNDPLYIVDGVPYLSTSLSMNATSGNILPFPGYSPLNSINPADIESIEVLKDADATAVYGSRGANGVILITTKKGAVGKTKVNVNFYTGAATVSRKMDLLSTPQYLEMRKEAFKNDGVDATAANARDLLVWDTTRYTDWQKELIGGTARTTDAQLSLSGGDKGTQFVMGGGYHKETTVFPGDNADQRVSVHAAINNTSPNQKLKTSLSINYSAISTNLISEDLTYRALTLPPNAPPYYDAEGKLSWTNWSSSFENPLAFTKREYESATNTLVGNAVIAYALLPDLVIKANLGYTDTGAEAVSTRPISSLEPVYAASAQNSSIFSRSSFKNWIVEPQLNWRPRVGEGFLDVLMGTSFMDQTSQGLVQSANGFSSEALMKNIASAPTIASGTNYYSQYRYQAVFGRVNYTLRERYIVNITGRRDGSSRFGPGKQFSVFGAIGSAWVFSKEGFVKNALPFLSFGKLRASYGTTGNDQIGDYQFLDTYGPSQSAYQGTIGLAPRRLYNPDFAWEKNEKLEGGIDLGFINDRVLVGVSYYRNRSSNQLVQIPVAPTTGFTSYQGNFPATVQNIGVEIELNTQNIQTPDFTWSTSLNLTVPANKLVEFPNIEASPDYNNRYVVGEPLQIRKRYHYLGIDPATGRYQFEDVNADGLYDVKDRQTIKFLGQDFYGGLQNSFQYKGFQLDVLFQYVKQQGEDYTIIFNNAPGTQFNQPALVMDRRQKPGDDPKVQLFTTGGTSAIAFTNFLSSVHPAKDASFIRLKNLSFSYSLPPTWARKARMTNVKIFIQGQNLLTLTDYEGLDPEAQVTSLPPLKTLTGGIHLTF